MPTVGEEFLNKFNTLEGVTVAERQKNFFKLLHQIAQLKDNIEHLDFIATNLKANSFLEDLQKVEFFIYFRRTSELLQTLKEGNSVFVSKVAKQSWFFKEAFSSLSADQIVNEILPCMSYSVRMKVLRKISRYSSSEKFDKIYDALVARYGIYLASQFITGCSPDKVRRILIEYPMNLTSTQLRILYEKDQELVDYYFIHSGETFRTNKKYKSLVKFIFNTNRDHFDHLKQKYSICINFGRRTSKKFAAANKDAIIKKPDDFRHLDMKAVIRKIGKDSVKLFANSLVGHSWITSYRAGMLHKFPKKYHYSLVFGAFQTHFGIKFEDYPDLIDENLIKMVPDGSKRAVLAKAKVDQGSEEYLKYLLINESVPLIKEKINFTSDIHERGKWIQLLVETCHINDDPTSLFSVLKYFCFRHKNDEPNVHDLFIRNVEKLFGFKNFTEEMWTCMNELLMSRVLRFDTSDATYQKIQTLPLLSFNLGLSRYQRLCYLEFLFKKGESIDEFLRENFTSDLYPKYGDYDKSFEKYVLFFALNNLSKQSDTDDDITFNLNLIWELDRWNIRYKEDQLSFYDFPILLDTFNYVIRHYRKYKWENTDHIIRIFREKIFTLQQNTHRNQYLEVYWQNPETYLSLLDIKWFLKYDPCVVVANFESIFLKLIEDLTNYARRRNRFRRSSFHSRFPKRKNNNFWFILKRFRHLQLDQKFIDKSLTTLSEEDPNIVKTKYIPCLSILMNPSDYAALADSYKPKSKKLDLENEKEVSLYQLQCTLATGFKHQSYEVLSSLLHYCAGDYFKYAMPALYSLLYRTPENMLPQYLNYLSNKAVSVRKHALYMTRELSTSTEVENMLKLLNKQEGVLSLQKHMFATTIQYFVKNPTDSIFELVKLNMLFITKADNESLTSITSHLREIPKKYQATYILHAWEHLQKAVDVWQTLARLKNSLLANLNREVVKEIPIQWGLEVIQKHFMTDDDKDLDCMTDFIFTFVTYKEEKSAIFDKVFTLLDNCNDKEKSVVLGKVFMPFGESNGQGRVFKFLHNWYSKIMDLYSTELKYLNPYVTYFETKITPIENFSDYIKVFFLKLKLEHLQSLSVDDLASKVLTFFDEVSGNYGPHVTHLFASEMDKNLSYFTKWKSTKNHIYHAMIKQRPAPLVAVLLLHVVTKTSNYVNIFKAILCQMKSIDDTGVQIILQCKFKNDLAHHCLQGDNIMEVDQ